jgi:hypothetical protein
MRKFRAKPLALGTEDCIVMARYHLVQMGHKGLPALPRYRTAVGAVRALKEALAKLEGGSIKAPTLENLVDALLSRIAPATMLPGDLALVPEDPEGATGLGGSLVVSVGRKFVGWHPDSPEFAVMELVDQQSFLAAWRA